MPKREWALGVLLREAGLRKRAGVEPDLLRASGQWQRMTEETGGSGLPTPLTPKKCTCNNCINPKRKKGCHVEWMIKKIEGKKEEHLVTVANCEMAIKAAAEKKGCVNATVTEMLALLATDRDVLVQIANKQHKAHSKWLKETLEERKEAVERRESGAPNPVQKKAKGSTSAKHGAEAGAEAEAEPAWAVAPEAEPAGAVAPEAEPAGAVAPEAEPAGAVAPEAEPAWAVAPEAEPAGAVAPEAEPAGAVAPEAEPAGAVAPEAEPAGAVAPEAEPAGAVAPEAVDMDWEREEDVDGAGDAGWEEAGAGVHAQNLNQAAASDQDPNPPLHPFQAFPRLCWWSTGRHSQLVESDSPVSCRSSEAAATFSQQSWPQEQQPTPPQYLLTQPPPAVAPVPAPPHSPLTASSVETAQLLSIQANAPPVQLTTSSSVTPPLPDSPAQLAASTSDAPPLPDVPQLPANQLVPVPDNKALLEVFYCLPPAVQRELSRVAPGMCTNHHPLSEEYELYMVHALMCRLSAHEPRHCTQSPPVQGQAIGMCSSLGAHGPHGVGGGSVAVVADTDSDSCTPSDSDSGAPDCTDSDQDSCTPSLLSPGPSQSPWGLLAPSQAGVPVHPASSEPPAETGGPQVQHQEPDTPWDIESACIAYAYCFSRPRVEQEWMAQWAAGVHWLRQHHTPLVPALMERLADKLMAFVECTSV
ncbi:hypothetical protein V8C86DRAFT_3024451 [Haematococcus lacustris]